MLTLLPSAFFQSDTTADSSPDATDDSPTENLSESADSIIDTITEALPRIGVALLVVVGGYLLSRALRWGLARLFRQGDYTPSFVQVMSKLASWLLLIAAVMIAISVVFPSVKPVDLLAGLGFISVAVGFAFQDILENTLAGVLLLLRQPFESGDQIEVMEQTGTVDAITIRETRLITYDGELVLIPNRDVYKSVIRVQTHNEDRRHAFIVGIAYENDAREATDVMHTALAGLDFVNQEKGPEVFVQELGVSTVNIEARFWSDSRQLESRIALDEAMKTVITALNDNGIEMPADIIALQATPSFRAALQGDADVTPGGAIKVPASS